MPRTRLLILAAAALLCAGCTSTYTGPVEVTRFVAEQPEALGKGRIALQFPEELTNQVARDALRGAIGDELGRLGYTVVGEGAEADQIALIESRRSSLAPATRRNGPVNVGIGGGTGGFGGGLGGGVGIGINLGGGQSGPRVLSELSVAIAPAGPEPGVNLWEGRATFPTSLDSPYAPVSITARTLATALFRDFPGGNGDTVVLDAKELVPTKEDDAR
ncbi:MAG: hypothetical protein AAF127_07775 [Pseudomonadota bacterium]